MELILTAACNLRCSYCWETGKKADHMSEETAMAAVDFLMDVSGQSKKLSILFFGGEPLLRFDLMRRVWKYATQRASERGKTVAWDMTTNGTLITADIARWCAAHKIKYLLSLDGAKETHDRYRKFADGRGSFEVIARKIPVMKHFQPWLGARMSVTPQSCAELCRGVEELHGLGINQFLLGYVHGIPWSLDDLRGYECALRDVCELYLKMRYHRRPFRMTMFEAGDFGTSRNTADFGCGAGRGRFSVDPYGDVYGCSKMANITGTGKGVLPMGNVHQGFTRIDNRIALLQKSIDPRRKCQQCEFKEECAGGCPAISYFHSGNIYEADDLSCRQYFISRRVNDYMRRRYKEVFGREMEEDRDSRYKKPDERSAQAPADTVAGEPDGSGLNVCLKQETGR